MTENLIKDVKKILSANKLAKLNEIQLIEKENEEIVFSKLEEVADYLKDALGRGIEF